MFKVNDFFDGFVVAPWHITDCSPIVEKFNKIPGKGLKIDGDVYSVYTKLAFLEFENGNVEEGLAYLLTTQKANYTIVSEICFSRIKTVSALYRILEEAQNSENFSHNFLTTTCVNNPEITRLVEVDPCETKTHLGPRRGITRGDALVTDDAVFMYGENLLDGWTGTDIVHVFSSSEWIIQENFVGLYKDDTRESRGLSEYENLVKIEKFDSNCELHQMARALPFLKEELFNSYVYRPGKYDLQRTLLLPIDL